MDNISQETLRRVTQNDPSLTELTLLNTNNYGVTDGKFVSDSSDDYSTLGSTIANNTHVEELSVIISNNLPLGVADRGFYNGLKSNSSINKLIFYCRGQNIAGGVGQEILKAYQENNNHLTVLYITAAYLQNGGDRVIVDTLRNCRNLQRVTLDGCNITDEQLLPIVDAIRGHRLLEELGLGGNNIENAGCDAIAALLTDPNCNLRALYLGNNAITTEGATKIANSLVNNNKLHTLFLQRNQFGQTIQDVFSNVLCNTSSIEQTYSSNHTLIMLMLGVQEPGQHLASLLRLNILDTNKSHVAIKKILKYHPNIDIEQLFQWDADGEQTLKALPHVINWFERARVAVAANDEDYNINERKLSAIFQYARVMPLLFVPPSHIKVDTKKRKRSG